MSSPLVRKPSKPTLSRFVGDLRLVSPMTGPTSYVRLPDGEVDLVVRVTTRGADLHVIGTRLRALHKVDDSPQAIAVRFRAGGAYPFFGVPMSELTDRVVPLATLWQADGRRLAERIAEARSGSDRLVLLEDALSERLASTRVFEPASAHLARRAVRAMVDSPTIPRVDELAGKLSVSTRQLRRIFDDVVGVGPKAFARIVRVQRAIRAAEREATPDWGAIALSVGYYDQAHMIGDFRELIGATPATFARELLLREAVAARPAALAL